MSEVKRYDLAEYAMASHPLGDYVRFGDYAELQAENERLKGIKPELPPFPPAGAGLPRYGLRWNGPESPLAVPMDDGYWTPYHLAAAVQSCAVDAKRYRWLRDCHDPGDREPRVHRIDQDQDTPHCRFCHGDELDAAVDKAMRSTDPMGNWVPPIDEAIAQCLPQPLGGCALVGCKLTMPHSHEWSGPVQTEGSHSND